MNRAFFITCFLPTKSQQHTRAKQSGASPACGSGRLGSLLGFHLAKVNPANALFIAGFVFVLTPWASPPIALTLGLLLGLTLGNPFPVPSRKVARYLLQASVVGLGFGMNFAEVVRAGRTGFLYTAVGITFAMLVGLTLARLLSVRPTAGFLISTGTAICGGSAIAAVGPVAGANDE